MAEGDKEGEPGLMKEAEFKWWTRRTENCSDRAYPFDADSSAPDLIVHGILDRSRPIGDIKKDLAGIMERLVSCRPHPQTGFRLSPFQARGPHSWPHIDSLLISYPFGQR